MRTPTGPVKPEDPDAKIQFVPAEAQRGVGGIAFDARGNQFTNELAQRTYVTGERRKHKPQFRLDLNKDASDETARHDKHHTECE